MVAGIALLAMSAAVLAVSIMMLRQGLVLLAVSLYAAVTVWLTLEQTTLVLPALIIAIALETAGVVRVIRSGAGAPEPLPVTFRSK